MQRFCHSCRLLWVIGRSLRLNPGLYILPAMLANLWGVLAHQLLEVLMRGQKIGRNHRGALSNQSMKGRC